MKEYTVKELIEQFKGYTARVFRGRHEAYSGPLDIYFVTYNSMVRATKLSDTWSADGDVSFWVEKFYDTFQIIPGKVIRSQTKKENMKITLDKI